MSITTQQAQQLNGKVYSQDSNKVGSIGQIYLDDDNGAPTWATTKTGFFGSSETFVPLEGARVEGNDLYVDFSEAKIKAAPRIDPDGTLSPADEDELYRYYGLDGATDRADGAANQPTTTGQSGTSDVTDVDRDSTTAPAPGSDSGTQTGDDAPSDVNDPSEHGDDRPDMSADTVGHDRSGPTTDEAMTRSEERLKVGTAARESGRARLRKFVTTEAVTQTVPVRHEEVTLEREPITAENAAAAGSGPAISEEEHEVVLHEEVPVVEKDAVAVERIKLGKETVTEDKTVSEDVRKENIEMVTPDQVPKLDH